MLLTKPFQCQLPFIAWTKKRKYTELFFLNLFFMFHINQSVIQVRMGGRDIRTNIISSRQT